MTAQTYRPRDAFARGMAMGWGSVAPIRDRSSSLRNTNSVAMAWQATGKALQASIAQQKAESSTTSTVSRKAR